MPARRTFVFVVLTLLALAAYWQAVGLMQLVSLRLMSRSEQIPVQVHYLKSGPNGAGTSDRPRHHTTSARPIFDRNPFDSVTPRPLDATPEESDAETRASPDLEHSEGAPACAGIKALLIVSSATDSAWSMAALSVSGEPRARLVRTGEEIAGRTVGLVDWHRVVLFHGAAVCQLSMFSGEKSATSVPASASASARPLATSSSAMPTDRPPGLLADIGAKIRRKSPTEFEVGRQVVSMILDHHAELLNLRIVPEQENGSVVGVRLLGIRPDTLLGMLGLEDGDRLQSINGYAMGNPASALEAYARLQGADYLAVQLVRHGQIVNLDIAIR